MTNVTNYGPLWQIQEQIKAKKLLIRADHEDIDRITHRMKKTMKELEEYEKAEVVLRGINND